VRANRLFGNVKISEQVPEPRSGSDRSGEEWSGGVLRRRRWLK